MQETQIATEIPDTLILDEELVDHLAVPESSLYLWRERLKPDLFLKDEKFLAKAWDFVSKYMDSYGQPPDRAVMVEEFPEFDFQEPRHPVEFLLSKLQERYARNELKTALKVVARAMDDPLEARTIAYREFHRIATETASRATELATGDWQDQLTQYKNDVLEGRLVGASMGWGEITDALGGLRKGCLYYVVGRPKRFKSWMLLQSAIEAQLEGKRVLFLSLELPEKEMYHRYLCLATNVSWYRFTHGSLSSDLYASLKQTMEKVEEEYPPLTIARPDVGKRSVPELIELAKEKGAEAVYIDQMSFVESHRAPTGAQIWEQLKYQCADLKNAAVDQDIPIYIANQFNRLADNPTIAEMAGLEHIAGGDAVGQYADMLLGLYQSKDMRQSNILQFGTIDSRSFEHARWNFSVRLTDECNFHLVERVFD